ncbi:MAG: acyl-CoA dehydrogenase family protein [Dehalococcoidia bacterium]|nr:acyl-CoA dehydrogenase family protein [Dehalococcoidia bacterium]
MDFRLSPEEEAFRREVRAFLEREWPPRAATLPDGSRIDAPPPITPGYMPSRADELKLGAKGWLAVSWPVEYGGGGKPFIYQMIVDEELAYHNIPASEGMGRTIVAPTLLAYGTERQKQEFLPRLAKGEITFCLGYTEPEAGSDLASLRTRAVAEGDEYVISGSKIYTSGADASEYCWLLARTDPEAAKHRGLSLFMVPMDSPGVTVRPLANMLGVAWFNEVFFEDVRVSRLNLVGGENQGWQIVTTALSAERFSLYHCRSQFRLLQTVVEYARRVKKGGRPLFGSAAVRQKLAQLAIEFEVARLLSYRAGLMRSRGQPLTYESAMVKMFNTELSQRLYNVAIDMLGLYGGLLPDSARTVLGGAVGHGYLDAVQATIGAGASEVQRDIIARRALDMPRG